MTSVRHPVVLIDLDHTLFDSESSESWAFDEALGTAGIEDASDHLPDYRRINGSLWAAVERGELSPEDVRVERFRRLVERRGLDADPRALSDAYSRGLIEHGSLFPDALETLEELSGPVRLALVTNGIAEIQRARIARVGIERFFAAVVVSSEVGSAKPAPGIFDAVFAELGTGRDGALMVGDSLTSDIRGGADYGLATCWFNPEGHDVPDGVTMTYEISSLAALPGIIRGN